MVNENFKKKVKTLTLQDFCHHVDDVTQEFINLCVILTRSLATNMNNGISKNTKWARRSWLLKKKVIDLLEI